MGIINYISNLAIPIFIMICVIAGIISKNKIFDDFMEGANEGISIVKKLLPTLIGLFLAVGMLRASGFLDFIIDKISGFLEILKIPKEVVPLVLLRPISGSAAIAVATDIMSTHGVDTLIGKISSIIMGSTETTLYTIAVYTSCIKVKKTRGILFPALCADAVCVIVSIIVCSIL